jgi:hypothetical protein
MGLRAMALLEFLSATTRATVIPFDVYERIVLAEVFIDHH